jgi:GAF domain-containing protein
MAADETSLDSGARKSELQSLAASAARNIPGVNFASITLSRRDQTLETIASTDVLADRLDTIQYDLREGPCYAAVTDNRLVLINNLRSTSDFPRYGPRAADLGVGSQAAIQLVHDGENAGLNLYALTRNAFDHSTIQVAERFATQAAALLEYVEQVEQLGEALHTRTDIGTAVGILMERYSVDRNQAFAYLLRNSNDRNVKIRVLALDVINGTFTSSGA